MDNKLGERMKQRRLDLDLSQKELAKRAKISQGTIAQLEVGRNQGSGKILEIAIALGVSPEWLLYGKNPPERPQKVEHIIDDTDFLYSKDSAAGIKKLYLKTNNWDADYLDFIKSPDESMLERSASLTTSTTFQVQPYLRIRFYRLGAFVSSAQSIFHRIAAGGNDICPYLYLE